MNEYSDNVGEKRFDRGKFLKSYYHELVRLTGKMGICLCLHLEMEGVWDFKVLQKSLTENLDP